MRRVSSRSPIARRRCHLRTPEKRLSITSVSDRLIDHVDAEHDMV